MQERALPYRIQTAPMQVLAMASRVFTLREIHCRQVAIRLIRTDARTAELLDQQARDREHDIVNNLRVDAEAVLMRQQAIVGIALIGLQRAGRDLAISIAGHDGPDDVLDIPGMRS